MNEQQLNEKIKSLEKQLTGLIQTRDELQKSRDDMISKFQKLSETSHEGIILINSEGFITHANKIIYDLLDYSQEELINKPLVKFITEESREVVKNILTKLQSDEKTESGCEIELLCKNGTGRNFEINASIQKNYPKGNEIIFCFLDVTDKRHSENILKHRLAFEQIIASISTIFVNFPPERLDKLINYSLRKITEFHSLDRGYLYMFSKDRVHMELTHEWCRLDDCKKKSAESNILSYTFPWMMEKLKRQENICISDIQNLPPEAIESREFFNSRGMKFFLIVPLIFNQSLVGFLGFESQKTASVWPDEDIRLINLVAETIINAIKRKWSENALRESEERFRGIFEKAQIGIYRYSKNRVLELANPVLIEMLGYKSFEDLSVDFLKGKLFVDIKERSLFEKLLGKLNSIDSYETQWRHFDDTILEMSENVRTIKDDKGNIVCFEGFVENITDKKKARNALIQAKEEAERSSKMKSDFLLQMSHEIRTPVTAMINNSNMLKMMLSETISDNLDESFNNIAQGGMRIIRTIDMIIDMSELMSGSYKPNFETIKLFPEILSELISKYEDLSGSKSILFLVENNCNDMKIIGDRYSTKIIFEQVIDNAVKFTERGEIKISCKNSDGKFLIEITDTGIGIDDKYLPKVFEPFTQEEEGTNRRYEGNGLGLSLVKNYCEINNYALGLVSKKNVGTNVKISISV